VGLMTIGKLGDPDARPYFEKLTVRHPTFFPISHLYPFHETHWHPSLCTVLFTLVVVCMA
jgi:hypothetical protein